MAFLSRARKQDLMLLCYELGISVSPESRIVDIRDTIKSSPQFDAEFVKGILETVVEERLEKEKLEGERKKWEFEEKQKREERDFELEKLKLENRNVSVASTEVDSLTLNKNLQLILPKFDPKEEDVSLFLVLFERQMKLLNVSEQLWTTHLISCIPSEVARLCAREDEDKFRDYAYIKELLLKRFKLNAEKFRQLFSQHRKSSEGSWRDFYFELKTYFDGWLFEVKVDTYEKLRDFMITDQIKKRCPSQAKEHFLDDWPTLISPTELVEKLDAFEDVRTALDKKENCPGMAKSKPLENTFRERKAKPYNQTDGRPTLTCYGCGAPGFRKSKCPTCNRAMKLEPAQFGHVEINTCLGSREPITLLKINVRGKKGTVCADSGASHSIASDTLYKFLRKQNVEFEKGTIQMTLANGQNSTVDVLTTEVTVNIEGKNVSTKFIVLPEVKGNRTLLGVDFLKDSGIVLDFKCRQWFFSENPCRRFQFARDMVTDPAVIKKINMQMNTCYLREREGVLPAAEQRQKLVRFLREHQTASEVGGEVTPFVKHKIENDDHDPTVEPPYRFSSSIKNNVTSDMLSPPVCDSAFEIASLRSSKQIRDEQLKDEELRKIISCFEDANRGADLRNWTERGYLMNQGVLYRYVPDSDSVEAQLIIPSHERMAILKEYHDAPAAGHYGIDSTYDRISKRYYWSGMRSYIADYVQNCPECCRYKASNQKPSILLQTPVCHQRFETVAIDLFGPLPETSSGKKWIFIVEDVSSRWTELFALSNATAKECAITLIEQVFLRYGFPRFIISDSGNQFVNAVMQQVCLAFHIKQELIPVCRPEANPVERKIRDLKPQLAILVGNEHCSWEAKLPVIRFALNTAKCATTGQTAAFLHFGRELRAPDDMRTTVHSDTFVPEITPYLNKFSRFAKEIRDIVEH